MHVTGSGRLLRSAGLASLVRPVLVATLSTLIACKSDGPTAIAVTSLRFVSSPASITPGQAFSVGVELLGSEGQRATTSRDLVTIAAVGGTAITGPTTVAASDGLASFSGLLLSQTTGSVQFTASSAGLSVSTALLPVKAGPVALQQSSVSPGPCTILASVTTPLTFTFKDAFGNLAASLGVSLTANLAGTTFTPASGTTTEAGTFATSMKTTGPGSATVSANVDGTSIAFATPFVAVDAPAPTTMAFPGSVTGSLTDAVCLSGLFPLATHQFSTAVPTGAAFTITSAFAPVFAVKGDVASNDVSIGASQTPATWEWLLPAGTYFYRLITIQGAGAYTIQGAATAGNTSARDRVLVKPGTYGGQALAIDDFAYDDGSFYDYYYYRSAAPCTLTLKSSAFNPYFIVGDAVSGVALAVIPGSGVGNDAVIPLSSCQSGANPLAIVVNSLNGGETGAYTLVVATQGSSVRGADPGPLELVAPLLRVPADRSGLQRLLSSARKRR